MFHYSVEDNFGSFSLGFNCLDFFLTRYILTTLAESEHNCKSIACNHSNRTFYFSASVCV